MKDMTARFIENGFSNKQAIVSFRRDPREP